MKYLSELVAHTMSLVTLNVNRVTVEQVRAGTKSNLLTDGQWRDIYSNVLNRIYDGLQELVSADKVPYKTIEVEKEKEENTIEVSVGDLFMIQSVFAITKNGKIKSYQFRNLSKNKIVLQDCQETKVNVCYSIDFPLWDLSDLEKEPEIDLTQYGLSNVQLNWCAKYACAEIQEHIDTYKAYSDKQEVISEINRLPNLGTIPYQDEVETKYGI